MRKASAKQYIAIVEDDESLARSLARLLQVSGYQPVTYPSAEAFLDDINKPSYGCLLLDIQLGGMFGTDLDRRLNGNEPTVPVIFLSALEESETLRLKAASPCAVFLRKTDPADFILAEIESAIDRDPRDRREQ